MSPGPRARPRIAHQLSPTSVIRAKKVTTRQKPTKRFISRSGPPLQRTIRDQAMVRWHRNGGLQFGLRSAPFMCVQELLDQSRCRSSGYPRTPLNPRTNRWKACWGQPLTSSNLVSSAPARQGRRRTRPHCGRVLRRSPVSSVVSTTRCGDPGCLPRHLRRPVSWGFTPLGPGRLLTAVTPRLGVHSSHGAGVEGRQRAAALW